MSASEPIHELSRAEENALLREMNEDFAAMQADRERWAAYRAEVELWEGTLGDGPDEPRAA